MKKVIYRLIIFFTIPLTIFILITGIYYYNEKQEVTLNLKKFSNFENLIMGDSQMQRIKPNLFNYKTYNLASDGEHYYFTYQKIKKIISFKNHKVKRIILGFSLPHFSPVYNRLFDLKFPEGHNSLVRYLYFINLDNSEFIKLSDFTDKSTPRSIVKGIYSKPDFGGLVLSNYKNPDSITINRIFRMHYRIKKDEDSISSGQIKYLQDIQRICNKNNIELYLVSTPFHSLYKKKIDSLYFRTLKNTLNSLQNVKYINYLNEQTNPNWLSDANHLNSKGADIYSKMISDSIGIKTYNSVNKN